MRQQAARAIFRLDEAWAAVHGLDLKVPAQAQTALYLEIAFVLRAQAYWLAGRALRGRNIGVGQLVETYQPCADALRQAGDSLLSPFEQARAAARAKTFIDLGAPEAMARSVAAVRTPPVSHLPPR